MLMLLQGIPHLVILDGDDATVITLDGRTAIAKDQYGLEFPWRARTLLNMMPKPLKRMVKAQIVKVVLKQCIKYIHTYSDSSTNKCIIHWFSDLKY
jgi:predicted DCC family thiol-disulfide oxidoreductase YuxK